MKRVFIYSARSLFSSGIKTLLDAEPELTVIGWESDLEEAVERIQEMQPDAVLVVTDRRLVRPSPGERTTFLERVGGKARIVELNLEDNNAYVYSAAQFTISEVGDLVRAIVEPTAVFPESPREGSTLEYQRRRVETEVMSGKCLKKSTSQATGKEINMSNKKERKGLSRRTFLKSTGLGVAAAAAGGGLVGPQIAAAQEGAPSFETPPPPIPDSEISATVEAEIIVVGAGVAGLVAANAAVENGAKVVLFAASSAPTYRGGSFHAPRSKYKEAQGIPNYDVDKFYRRELSAAGYDVDQTKWWKFYNSSPEAINWLIDKMEAAGYQTTLENSNDQPDGLADPMYQPPSSHAFLSENIQYAGMGAELVTQTLEATAKAAGVEIRYKTVAKQLVREDNNTGRVTAVIAEGEDGKYVKFVGSKAIILATGDFSTNDEMLAKYCPKALPLRDDTGDQGYDNLFKMGGLMPGDGHKMGLWVGAAWQKTFPVAIMMGGGAGPSYYPYSAHSGLVVNKDGVRWGNETVLFPFAGNSMLHQPEMKAFSIWGTNYAEAGAPWPPANNVYHADPTPVADVLAGWEASVEAGSYVKGDTIEEVIQKLGLPAEATKATIDRYNSFCETGVDEDFHKQKRDLIGITEAPFYGAMGKPGLLTVCGGLRTNINMQVCDANDQPIPGLYNLGVMVGDYFGVTYTFRVEGNNLGANCLTFPYVTGRDIANGTLE